MALQQNINLPQGTNLRFKYTEFAICTKNIEETLENAYIKIDSLRGNKDKIYLDIGIYDKKDGICIFIKQYEFIPSTIEGSDNFIKQGYEYLKTLSEYTNAVDC